MIVHECISDTCEEMSLPCFFIDTSNAYHVCKLNFTCFAIQLVGNIVDICLYAKNRKLAL